MDSHLRVLADMKNQIFKAYTNYKKTPKERLTENYLESRLEMLEKMFENFSKKYECMVGEYGIEKLSSHFNEEVFEIVSEHYLNYKVDIRKLLCIFKNVTSVSSDALPDKAKSSIVKLPKIKIPIFSGNYSDWSSFRDLFTSLIHNNESLDDVQRLHYLRTQLSGEAEQLIKHMPITQNNYKLSWDILESRYNNKRFMANCILKRLFGQRGMSVESANALKELSDTTSDCLHELSNLGINVSSWDIIIIYVASLKLDVESRKQWELHISQACEELPTFKLFKEFLETRFRALEFVSTNSSLLKPKSRPVSSNVSHNVFHNVAKLQCPFCSEEHKLFTCKSFAMEDSDKRRDIAESLGVCYNCLGSNHTSKICRNLSKCRICQRRHHTLLHPKNLVVNNAVGTAVEPPVDEDDSLVVSNQMNTNVATHCLNAYAEGQVLLATALIRAESRDGSSQILRALVDQGSQASFITESAAQLLRLKKIANKTSISGIGGSHGDLVSRHIVKIKLQSIHDPSFMLEITAHVLGSLTSVIPNEKFKIQNWPEINTVKLADPDFNKPNKIDVLLGAEIYCHIVRDGLVKSPTGCLIAQDTFFGWIVSGQVSSEENSCKIHNRIMAMHAQVDENDMLKRLWELDSGVELTNELLSPEEKACEDYYALTTKRDHNGRYVVRLPFRCEDPPCKYGNSKQIALKRFLNLEKKLAKDIKLKHQYNEVLEEYLLLGHMEKIEHKPEKYRTDVVYLPHHAVVREDKLTTKVRVVFDASCKGTNEVSLNDNLMVGPPLQADLRHIVLRWRQHPICLVADIEKMYRQVKMAEEDTNYQRIVWRKSSADEIQDYRLLTVTFGTSSAPYLAVKSLQQVACDEGNSYPMAAPRIMSDFYMDDLISGCEDEHQAVQIYKELNELLKKGGFKLQKWSSNKNDLLENLKEGSSKDLEIKLDTVTKVLGLTWNRKTDAFDYSVKLSPPAISETKRTVISEISRLYDPLGWIAPCIITSKVFIQKLWISGIGWDEVLPSELLEEWNCYKRDLENLIKFHIPRWTGQRENVTVELHGFSDASNIAYAGVVYCRVIDTEGNIYSNLITAKTKVAPIKQISIPRLELNGALLVARLLTEVAKVMNVNKSYLRAWTDSSVVLAWLNDHPRRWKTYIANRTSEILTLMDSSQWGHVKSKDNPADIASRGVPSAVLLESDLWKCGPTWLLRNIIEYSKPTEMCTDLERISIRTHATEIIQSDLQVKFWDRFSSLRRLVRVTAFCRRFLMILRWRKSKTAVTPYLSALEIKQALDICIRSNQWQWFSKEIQSLKINKSLDKKSHLYSLNPFIDDTGLLRVGGRIRNSLLPEVTKHPVVIPHDSNLAKLIVSDAHERTLHGGQQLVINFIRTRYWIARLKNLVRTHIHGCINCIRYSAMTKYQLMGELPACRVTPSKPFLNAGVDYAGPINMRVSKGRGQRSFKGYICLFVCMTTRAVHIEAVSDLTAEGFLSAFRRFVSRRGQCHHIWSDNGTNFVGAAKELKALFKQQNLIFNDIAAVLANSHTEWHFIPPRAPHFGGLWEAGIKSVKHHLKRVIGDSTLTYEEMATVLSQIEACLNSRPLSQCSDELENLPPLTPGHFLVGQPLVSVPDNEYMNSNLNTLRRWQLVQRMVQSFWRRWSQEYLTQFFQRYKWSTRTYDFKINDIVLIKEDNLPPARWLHGKIIELHPGADGISRVVTVQCKGTKLKRPTAKLCLLPIAE